MKTARLEAFSDGVFAIAITLLVLNLVVPGATSPFLTGARAVDVPQAKFFQELEAQWPAYLAFLVSFVSIGVMWINHSWMFGHILLVTRVALMVNLIVLITVVLIPFTTSIMMTFLRSQQDQHATQHAAAWIYIGSLLAMAAAFTLLWQVCFKTRGACSDLKADDIKGATRAVQFGPFAYVVLGVLANWTVTWSLVLCLVLNVFYWYPCGRGVTSR